jgi:hypothetical protein
MIELTEFVVNHRLVVVFFEK